MIKAPLADGGDQVKVALGGMPLTRVGASGGPGQAVVYNNTPAHHSSSTIVWLIILLCIYRDIINANDEDIHILCNTVRRKILASETFCKSLAKWGGRNL